MKNIELTKEVKQEVITSLRGFFLNERSEDISEFQASIVLDFVLTNIGPYIYNQAIADAHSLMGEKIEELYGLEKRFR